MSEIVKTCNTCGEIKPLCEYHVKPSNRDGFTCRCKRCAYAANAVYRAENRDRHLARRREHYAVRRDEERKMLRDRFSRDPEKYRARNQHYKDKWPEYRRRRRIQREEYRQRCKEIDSQKFRAREAVGNAIKAGRLIRGDCTVCGQAGADAHHEDYSRPFEVVWLCRKHHMERHRKY